jgi:hypothetical protein
MVIEVGPEAIVSTRMQSRRSHRKFIQARRRVKRIFPHPITDCVEKYELQLKLQLQRSVAYIFNSQSPAWVAA